MGADQALVRHEASHSLPAAALIEATELGVDAGYAISSAGSGIDLFDQLRELGVSLGVAGLRS
jgi:hypothetical protein